MFQVPAAVALAVIGATPAMSEIPSPALIGVQRVVIACESVSGLTASERAAFCGQLVKKAAALTALPVSLASAEDLNRADLARQSKQLLLRVDASAAAAAQGRKTVEVAVTPVRTAVRMAPRAPVKSNVSFVKVGPDWMIQGPIEGFIEQLGSGPRTLRRPIRADR